ncbi:MAG: hypothetical protein JWL93_2790 [Hyphomicrobiales bacterium]|nr:hypothetical protein [Hyphomicrobiales bacterium]
MFIPRVGPGPVRMAGVCLVLSVSFALGGCKSMNDVTGSVRLPGASAKPSTMGSDPGSMRAYAESWGQRYDKDPSDKTAAMNYAAALRRMTQYSQATAVLQRAAAKHPNDMEVLGAYGKALADSQRLREAAEVLSRAHTPERPNWSILSAQGSVADQMGNHAGAQDFYRAALKINPEEPTVLSNLGLSFALSKDLRNADATLSRAAALPGADMRVRQNYALVLALQGKFTEAETVSRQDLDAAQAAANVGAIRLMIAQSDTWRDIRKLDGKQARSSR